MFFYLLLQVALDAMKKKEETTFLIFVVSQNECLYSTYFLFFIGLTLETFQNGIHILDWFHFENLEKKKYKQKNKS